MKRIIIALLAIGLLFFGCSEKSFDNPFDPDVEIAAPENVTWEISADAQVMLTWTDTYYNESGFRIDRKTGTANWETIFQSDSGNIHQFFDNDAPQYQDLQYRVAVIYDEKVSAFTTTNIIRYYPAPTDLVVSQIDINNYQLNWIDNCEGEDGYAIERSINSENFEQIDTVAGDVTTYSDNISSRNIYNIHYRVRAIVGEFYSAYIYDSKIMNFPAPTNMELLQIGLSSIRISWQINSAGHQGFYIDKKINGTWNEKFAEVGPNTPYFDDTNVELNEMIQYRVYAYSGNFYSESVETDEHSNNLGNPLNLHYTIESSTDITIHWDYMYSDLDGFLIERNHNNSGWELLSEVNGDVREISDSAFDIDEQFSYRVKAIYQEYESDFVDFTFDIYQVNESMILVETGNFEMGDSWGLGNSDEQPVHNVEINDFWISKHEVTFAEYDEYCQDTNQPLVSDQGWGRGNHPVINVNWLDAIRYCNWLSEQDGFTQVYSINGVEVTMIPDATGYALPSEAEWEYAAKGGNLSTNTIYSGSDNISEVGIYSTSSTNQIMQKSANELGIYDMSGNVWEWCWDWYDNQYYMYSPAQNPMGPDSGSYKVFRGGAWSHSEELLRVANRSSISYDYSSNAIGFRIIRRKN